MFGQLVPCGGGTAIALAKPRLLVGRTPDCDVMIPSGTVSSRHCQLELRDGVWHVSDLGSRNGIRIDGVSCKSEALPPGCILSIAQHRFVVAYAPPTGQPGPAKAPAPAATASTRSASSAALPARRPPEERSALLGELLPCGGGPPIPLRKAKLLVGRLPTCDVTIAHPTISSKHCELAFQEGYWHVRDLGSRNGIRVGGMICLTKYILPGEILSIARLRYELNYTPQADEPPPDENPFGMSLLEKAGLAGKHALDRLPQAEPDERDKKRWNITPE
ncbi:MAG: FHA domain-containing protein [Planctomycetales bacterium]